MPFSVRIPIAFPDTGRSDLCMLRALETVVNELYDQGRAAFHRATDMHTVDRVFISLGEPWQETKIETQVVSTGKQFTFSRELLSGMLQKREKLEEGKKELQNEVVATLLNGYQTADPYGKRAKRADVIFMSSSMNGETMSLINRSVKRLPARQGARLAPLESLANAVLRAQFPHDADFLVMLVSDEATGVMIANRGIILDATSVPIGLQGLMPSRESMKTLAVNGGEPDAVAPQPALPEKESTWATSVAQVLRAFGSRHALPRIIFLVATDGSATLLKHFLDTPAMHELWLSDEPVSVIPVVSKLLSSFIRHQGQGDADVMLDLLTLFADLTLKKG